MTAWFPVWRSSDDYHAVLSIGFHIYETVNQSLLALQWLPKGDRAPQMLGGCWRPGDQGHACGLSLYHLDMGGAGADL